MRTVDCRIEINSAPETIIQAFTGAEMLKGWWGVEKSLIELKQAGIYTTAWFVSENGLKYISTGVIKEFIDGKKLHVDDYMYLSPERPFLGPLNLIVEASAAPKGSLLRLQQGPYPVGRGEDWDWYYEAVNDAWPKVLQTLKQYLEK
ncbi:MAG: SRPBCC family protein [Bacteroidota bacterium]